MDANAVYARALSRAFGGALLFSFPLLMTMEMWSLGIAVERWRLLVFLLLTLPMLIGLSYYAGFEPTFRLKDEVLDALAAFGVGFLLAAVLLGVFGVLRRDDILTQAGLGKIALCAAPAAVGALLAGKQLGERGPGAREKERAGPLSELFLMAVGAAFLAFNVAPTEEMVLIAYQMGPWATLALVAISILLLHVFVYQLGFPGETRRREAGDFRRTFVAFTCPGYGVALLMSLYLLWTFGRTDGVAAHEIATMTVVLGFPAAIGAATARLVI
ncbi:TIGR02587 family membrane protein [Caulobacter zeae]|uniref:TIGR02587 family membrane protein n=1 Tax=Caulobacter zeae TaxID=2055137 RepID=A0A2N5DRN5_9CAUL|nr:TIGR02587 family membrane protein [Caulobacter zeae]PLR28708.1 TIGR02587 family membrane protein [Caulobacter zeae]